MSKYRYLKYATIAGGVAGTFGLMGFQFIPKLLESYQVQATLNKPPVAPETLKRFNVPLPSRAEQLKILSEKEYDVLVIGGGATGSGVALDAASRGLQTALVEKFDFASGTSSKSTKLIHGGVRYLQKAVFNLDLEQYRMVKEALGERANLIEIAPHLAYPLPIMLPIYKWWQVPYYWAGIKMYDVVSGLQILKASYYLGKSRALECFPMLKRDKLVGALVYYDGQQEDARMCLSIAITAARMGASIANYTKVIEILKRVDEAGNEVACGAKVRDLVTGKEFDIRAKSIINATGPYTDFIRLLDNKKTQRIVAPSSGVHIVLPGYYSPANMGLLDPDTKDGRIIFFLPWQGCTMAGTTDNPCPITHSPSPQESEVQFILGEIRDYLTAQVKVRRGDVHSAWSGIRPLVKDPNKADTQSIARNHVIEVSPSRMVTIAGGKWTTYRHMAEEAVDKAVEVCNLPVRSPCITKGLLLEGAHTYTPNLFIQLVQDFGMETAVAQHLANTYGDKASKVAHMCGLTGKRWPVTGIRIHPDFPYLEAEINYACKHEYACRAVDIISRRTRIAFLNAYAAQESLPRIIELMAKELNWDKKKQQEELEDAKEFLKIEMGVELRATAEHVPINFSKDEINQMVRKFQKIDQGSKGFITVNDLRWYIKNMGEHIDDKTLHDILSEVDINKNGEIDLGEFLQFMSALKTGAVADSRFQQMVVRDPIPVDRSGGGL